MTTLDELYAKMDELMDERDELPLGDERCKEIVHKMNEVQIKIDEYRNTKIKEQLPILLKEMLAHLDIYTLELTDGYTLHICFDEAEEEVQLYRTRD